MRSRILGELTRLAPRTPRASPTDGDDYVISRPLMVPLLKHACTFECFVSDAGSAMPRIDAAVERFLRLGAPTLATLRPHLRDYLADVVSGAAELGLDDVVRIPPEADLLDHITLGATVNVVVEEDGTVYLSIEGDCAWEEEHGLQIVFRDGDQLCKVGPYDGHVTNVDAFDREDFAGVVYVKASML